MCAPGSLCLPLKMPTPSRHESQSVTADAICYDTSDSQRKCDMTMLVYIIVVSRRMNCVGRQFHLVDSV